MISVFVEAALRSLLVGLAVMAGLRAFRVRNVLAQKAAWGLVLASALAMPLLLPITAQWKLLPAGINIVLPAHPMTLLEELQALVLAKSGSGNNTAPATATTPQSNPPDVHTSPTPEPAAGPHSDETETSSSAARVHRNATQPITSGTGPMQQAQLPAPIRRITISPVILALVLYCGIAALFLARLALGLLTTIRLWRTATPIPANQLPHDAASLQIRASDKVSSPVTIGSVIVLPADYATWDSEKLHIVLAHERSHIRQGDFYLQLLAGLYSALVWFSPLGWWLRHELAELAEAISDRAGMEQAASCTSYAQILLEFAAAPRPTFTPIGVAMARPGSLSRRIERLLNDNSFRQCFAGGRRALAAVVLVPLALFASTALVRVHAATSMQMFSPAPKAVTALQPAETPQPASAAQTAQPNDQALPQVSVDTPDVVTISSQTDAPDTQPTSEMIAMTSPAPVLRMAPVVTTAVVRAQDSDSLSFDRTLSVSGAAQLAVSTGSGNIHIKRGSGNQVVIHGKITVSHDGSEEEARQIAANPPIEQNGDAIRIGPQHEEHWHGISINYEIEAPAGTQLTANSGSGDITDEGVGQNAKLQTGSGDIKATSLEGPFTVMTGSGNITATQTGQGDAVAQTGSGDIVLKDIHGGFRGQTGSGNIKASGTPSAAWDLQTGSGNVELWTNNAPLTFDASTGSGSVTTANGEVSSDPSDHHHVRGSLNGGGPTIRLQTGSGDVHIH